LSTPLVPEEMCTSRSHVQPRLRVESQDLSSTTHDRVL
jgi:hypothetical protein